MLETVVPKSDHDSIMVVLGEHRGQVSQGSSFLQDMCTVTTDTNHSICICLLRSAVFSNGTKTSAERWFNSTDTKRKCSHWTMTVFVTTSEQQTTDPHISDLYSNISCPFSSHLKCCFVIFKNYGFKILKHCNFVIKHCQEFYLHRCFYHHTIKKRCNESFSQ